MASTLLRTSPLGPPSSSQTSKESLLKPIEVRSMRPTKLSLGQDHLAEAQSRRKSWLSLSWSQRSARSARTATVSTVCAPRPKANEKHETRNHRIVFRTFCAF